MNSKKELGVAENSSKTVVLRLQKAILVVNILLLGLVLSVAAGFKDNSPASFAGEEVVIVNDAGLIPYSQNRLSDKKTNILFFNASWCSHCKATIENLKKDRNSIDKNLNILSIDPDAKENAELVTKYQVTGFPTFVKVDKDGNQIEKWSGQTTVEKLNSKK